MNRWFGLLSFLWCVPMTVAAQDTTASARRDTLVARPDTTIAARPAPTVTLSLDDALTQARRNSPTYRQTLNDAGPAKWAVRNAYGNLLPQFNVSSDLGYIGSGQSNVGGGFIQPTSAFLTSDYSLGIVWQIDGRALSGPGQQKALKRATDEDISGAGVALRSEIATQYLNTLQATAQVAVAMQQVSRNRDFLALAKARYQVGQATLLDVRQAEVIKGQSDVALLRAVQTENEAKLDLIRRMGVEPPVPVEQIALTDSFPVTAPSFDLDTLLRLADAQNPALRSLRARGTAASWNVRAAKSEFLPTLSLQAGWSGFTQQFTNSGLLLEPIAGEWPGPGRRLSVQQPGPIGAESGRRGAQLFRCRRAGGRRQCVARPGQPTDPRTNNAFPFHYTGQPFQANLPGFAADLHRIRPFTPGLPSQGAGRRR